jgi:hypothetical protein
MKIITKIPVYISPTKIAIVSIFRWPNGSYSLYIRRPTKLPSRTSIDGMLIGHYYNLTIAKTAAEKWKIKHNTTKCK